MRSSDKSPHRLDRKKHPSNMLLCARSTIAPDRALVSLFGGIGAMTKTGNVLQDQVSKVFSEFRFPSVNVDAVVTSQQKNVDALRQVHQLAIEGAQQFLVRQLELGREAADEFSAIVRDLASAPPEDRLLKQAEFSRRAIEKGLANTRELTELLAKSNGEAFNILSKRVAESFEEVRDYATKAEAA
jgi:phasin family protein